MINATTIAVLRAILDEICEGISGHGKDAKAHVASKILEVAAKGEALPDNLKSVGRRVLSKRQLCGGSGR